MAGDRAGQILKRAALMQAAGLGNGEQAGGSMLSSRATITEADLAPLYAGSQGTFGAVIGGLDASMLQKGEQLLGMFKQRPCQVLDLAIRAVQMGLSRTNKRRWRRID